MRANGFLPPASGHADMLSGQALLPKHDTRSIRISRPPDALHQFPAYPHMTIVVASALAELATAGRPGTLRAKAGSHMYSSGVT